MAKKSTTETLEISITNIQDKIFTIRGEKVMLDSDLAKIYGYTTKAFNQQWKNNIEKFEGDDFMFQLTKGEAENSRSEFVTSSWNEGDFSRSNFLTLNDKEQEHLRSKILTSNRGGIRYLPYAFTEQGMPECKHRVKNNFRDFP